jgi:hypothetical protein
MSMTSLHLGQRAFLPAALSGALIDAPHKGQMTIMAKPPGRAAHHRLLFCNEQTKRPQCGRETRWTDTPTKAFSLPLKAGFMVSRWKAADSYRRR